MIFHDRVHIIVSGGRDPKGNPLPDIAKGPYPAQVNPIRSSESVERGALPLTSFYRLVIGKTAGKLLTYTSKVTWNGRTFMVQGDVEPWKVNNRLHHFEATLKL